MLDFGGIHASVLVNTILRSVAIYLAVVFALRLAGKRHVGQLSIVDFVLILLVSNAVQNAMVGPDTSLAGGLVAWAGEGLTHRFSGGFSPARRYRRPGGNRRQQIS